MSDDSDEDGAQNLLEDDPDSFYHKVPQGASTPRSQYTILTTLEVPQQETSNSEIEISDSIGNISQTITTPSRQ